MNTKNTSSHASELSAALTPTRPPPHKKRRWRTARQGLLDELALLQWANVDALRGRASLDALEAAIWRFMSCGLGHSYDHLFSVGMLANAEAVTIPGGDDLYNRFAVHLQLPGDSSPRETLGAETLARHEICWLITTTGAEWTVSRVLEHPTSPEPFLRFDILRTPDAGLLEALGCLTLAGMASGRLRATWTRNVADASATASRLASTTNEQGAPRDE